MDNKSCSNGGHQYGLWNIDKMKNVVYRSCFKCSHKVVLPITEEVVMEITKQDEASKIFKAFQMVDNNDENIINYLELIFEDYINYLCRDDYLSLVKRIKKLEQLDIIDAKNILYLQKLDTYFVVNNEDVKTELEIVDTELAYEQ